MQHTRSPLQVMETMDCLDDPYLTGGNLNVTACPSLLAGLAKVLNNKNLSAPILCEPGCAATVYKVSQPVQCRPMLDWGICFGCISMVCH